MKKKYDLICSLGGNCSVAHNLLYKGLRRFSLPFDWCYMIDDTPLYKLAECFDNDFLKFFLKKNLKPLPEGQNKSHLDKYQYYDIYSGYRFVNHFITPIEKGGYRPVREKMERRIARMYEYITKGNKILFLLSLMFEIDIDSILNLQKTLKNKWPDKQFDFIILLFDCSKNDILTLENIQIYKYTRKTNEDDFVKTNPEWNFLNTISLNPKLYPRQYLLKFAIRLIPFRNLRHKLKRKYHVQ